MSTPYRYRWLGRAAAGSDIPVFVARGLGSGGVDARLRSSPRLRLLDSPRAATVLVVAGHVPAEMAEPLARVHDQMAHPRATVWWTGDADGRTDSGAPASAPEGWEHATVLGPGASIEEAVAEAHRSVVTGARPSDPALLPDVDPVPWRGVGPYGHGGTAMTGGVPYGRPMAGRGDDLRDGLSLDVVPLKVGPFFPLFPAGLVLTVTFAGDVVNDVTVEMPPPFGSGAGLGSPLPDGAPSPFEADSGGPQRVADVERARARQHLQWLARISHLYGLDALARRIARAAVSDRLVPQELAGLERNLARPWALDRPTRRVGVLTGDGAAVWGGPVARAAGIATDVRSQSAAYSALGFETIVHPGGDNRDRWRQRLAEAVQAVELAGRAGAAVIEAGEPVEAPVQQPPADAAERLAAMLVGAEWGDAVSMIASLDPPAPLPALTEARA